MVSVLRVRCDVCGRGWWVWLQDTIPTEQSRLQKSTSMSLAEDLYKKEEQVGQQFVCVCACVQGVHMEKGLNAYVHEQNECLQARPSDNF